MVGMPTSTPSPALKSSALEAAVDQYHALQTACYRAFRANPSLLGKDEWLRAVISEQALRLEIVADGIECTGHCYSMQSCSTEYFDFFIPFEALEL